MQPPEAPPTRAMPRPAIKAIAASGIFCAFMTCFMVYFAWRMGFGPVLIVLNAVTAVVLFVGSFWMLWQLRRSGEKS